MANDTSSTEALEPASDSHIFVRRFVLRVLDGPDAETVFESKRAKTVVGTHRSTHMTLTDPTLSRFHCEIEIAEGEALIRDLESKNGTVVDGVKVFHARLADGAILTLGNTRLRFELTDQLTPQAISERSQFGSLVSETATMRAVFAQLERAAVADVTVLLQGETGTGKDLAAHSIHQESTRSEQPFVVVDCGAVSPHLLPSELFGHRRGAFTGADSDRQGAFERASGGTVFLDEVGELGIDLQPQFLRVLESREVTPVGGSKPIPVDVRVIAATNRDLYKEVNAKRFRSDLYFRIAVVEVTMPPLRAHRKDIPVLAHNLLETLGASPAQIEALLTDPFLTELGRYHWPGNVRELRSYLEKCAALDEPPPLGRSAGGGAGPDALPEVNTNEPLRMARRAWQAYFERRYLEQILSENGDNVTASAKAAGLDRAHFHRLLSKHGLR